MRYVFGSLLSTLVCAVAFAAPPEVPATLKVKPGQLVRVNVKADTDKLGSAKNFTDSEAFWGELVGPKGSRQFVFQAPAIEVGPDGKPVAPARTQWVVSWWTVGESDGVATTITLDYTAPPPPAPVPPTPPTPPVPPTPPAPTAENPFGSQPGLRVLIVYETADAAKLPSGQFLILQGKKFRDYLDGKCAADGYRMVDQNIKPAAKEWWTDAMKRTDRTAPTWLYVGKESTGFSGPLPADADSTIALIAKFAGN